MSEERILNGGFEDWTDHWTGIGDGTGALLPWIIAPHTGTVHALCAPDPGDTWGITQSVNFTNVNTLTFWQYMGGSGLRVYIDDTLLGTYPSVGMAYYQQKVDVSGRKGVHILRFLFADDEWTFLDDISALADKKYWYELSSGQNAIMRRGDKHCRLLRAGN